MSDPIKRTGHIREIDSYSLDGRKNILRLRLTCGHCAIIRWDTVNGSALFQSFQQTAWQTWECQLCNGSEYDDHAEA